MEDIILQNAIQTPDGTILLSASVHDYIGHTDENGYYYSTDGGSEYLKRSMPMPTLKWYEKLLRFIGMYKDKLAYIDLTIAPSTEFKDVRARLLRGTKGKYNDEEFRYERLKDMDSDWIKAVIKYNKKYKKDDSFVSKMCRRELELRDAETPLEIMIILKSKAI